MRNTTDCSYPGTGQPYQGLPELTIGEELDDTLAHQFLRLYSPSLTLLPGHTEEITLIGAVMCRL